MEDRELDVALGRQRREPLLRAVDLPLRRQVAAVLARVGVADHDLEPAVTRRLPAVEQLGDDVGRGAQVGDRLEERHDRERLVRELENAEDVLRRARPRHDHRVERLGPVPPADPRGGVERLPHPRRRRVELVHVEADVQLREVETEQL